LSSQRLKMCLGISSCTPDLAVKSWGSTRRRQCSELLGDCLVEALVATRKIDHLLDGDAGRLREASSATMLDESVGCLGSAGNSSVEAPEDDELEAGSEATVLMAVGRTRRRPRRVAIDRPRRGPGRGCTGHEQVDYRLRRLVVEISGVDPRSVADEAAVRTAERDNHCYRERLERHLDARGECRD